MTDVDNICSVVLVGDPGPLMETLTAALERERGFLLRGCVHDESDLRPVLVRHAVNLALIDADTARPGPIDNAHVIRTLQPQAHIVFVCRDIADGLVEQALRVEARGVILKADLPDALLTAVREVASGGTSFPTSVRERIIIDKTGMRLAPSDRE